MRKILNTALLLLIVPLCLSAQWWGKGYKPEGKVVTKTLDLENFDQFSLSLSGRVKLTLGNKQSVKITAQEDLFPLINTDVMGTKWKLKFTEKVRNYDKLMIEITMTSIESLSVAGSGYIEGTNQIQNKKLDLAVAGSGDMDLDIDVGQLDAAISGSGTLELEGLTNDMDLSISGSGDVFGFDLETGNADISVSGSGTCKITCNGRLEASVSGSGDVFYKGQPKIESRVSGSGSVRSQN